MGQSLRSPNRLAVLLLFPNVRASSRATAAVKSEINISDLDRDPTAAFRD